MTAQARAEFERLARLYFTTVHRVFFFPLRCSARPGPYASDFGFLAFLHQPTFFRLLANDRIPDELRLTVCAVTMR